MSQLFDSTTINGMELKNRLIRSATWEGMCEKSGRPTERLIKLYEDLAEGEVGLIITGYTFVRPEGKQLPGKMGIHTDEFEGPYTEMTRRVHSMGGKICMQLVHAGGQTDTANAGQKPLAPSAIKTAQYGDEIPQAMTKKDIQAVIEAFAQGAQRAQKYGFDAVQLHAAHGYLINQFLSPLTNQREDEYGGDVDKRCRFLMETYRAVRQSCGSDYPVLVKLNGSDFLEGGLELDDAVYAAKLLDSEGINAIEVSGGTPASGSQGAVRANIDTSEKEAYNVALAQAIKKATHCPVMVVGGFRSPSVIERIISENIADYVSIARPLIREPQLAKRWHKGDQAKAACISCNGCFKPGLSKGGIYCVVAKKREKSDS